MPEHQWAPHINKNRLAALSGSSLGIRRVTSHEHFAMALQKVGRDAEAQTELQKAKKLKEAEALFDAAIDE